MSLISCRWMRLSTESGDVICTYDDSRGCGICPHRWQLGECPIADEVIE